MIKNDCAISLTKSCKTALSSKNTENDFEQTNEKLKEQVEQNKLLYANN